MIWALKTPHWAVVLEENLDSPREKDFRLRMKEPDSRTVVYIQDGVESKGVSILHPSLHSFNLSMYTNI